MLRLLANILLFVAALAAPFGMAAAPAAPAGHAIAAGMPAEHCPDDGRGREDSDGVAECTMGCAAALPAFDGRAGPATAMERDPVAPLVAERLTSLQPEIATPPPKLA